MERFEARFPALASKIPERARNSHGDALYFAGEQDPWSKCVHGIGGPGRALHLLYPACASGQHAYRAQIRRFDRRTCAVMHSNAMHNSASHRGSAPGCTSIWA